MTKLLLQSIRQTIFWTVVTGLLYPLVMTLLLKAAFPRQAGGSLVTNAQGEIVGSAWLAQPFTGNGYFWPRPSAAGYATVPSGASNLGPTSQQLQTNVQTAAAALRQAHQLDDKAPVPSDLVFTSASGLDPHISPEAARFQIKRVADARGLSADDVGKLVDKFVEPAQWGFLGEPRVNVLLLNLALDGQWPKTKPPITPPPAAGQAPAPPA